MNCDHLEDYLCQLLTPAQAAAFQEHLIGCSDCANEVTETQHLFRTLRDATESLEQCPPSLLSVPALATPAPEPARRKRSPLPLAASITAVALLCCLALQPPDTRTPWTSTDIARPEASVVVAAPEVSLPAGVVGFPVESSDPNIRIVMLYNRIQPDAEDPPYQLP